LLVLAAIGLAGHTRRAVSAEEAANATAESESRLSDAVTFLASDEQQGRGIGTAGLDRAAEFIAEQFAAAGLETKLYDGAPFQRFSMRVGARLGEGNKLAFMRAAEAETIDVAASDFTPLALGGSGDVDLPVVFAGYGITAKDLNYDDYAGIDVTGKAVIVLRHEPQQSNPHSAFEGTRHSEHAPLARKVSNAYEHGAAAVIFVSTEEGVLKELRAPLNRWQEALDELTAAQAEFAKTESPTLAQVREHQVKIDELLASVKERGEKLRAETDPLLDFGRSAGEDGGRDFPVVQCRRTVADKMLQASLGKPLAELEAEIDNGPTPHSAELAGWRVQGQIRVERQDAEVKNVVAVLPGEGPHAEETIVIGAHYDHLGNGGPGSLAPGVQEIHNGADDNGSGTAALLEVARRLASRPQKLPRRIVFIAFTGEERGLIGSARYVRDPLVPLDKTIAMLNMDMVGRLDDDKLIIYGTGTADLLEQTVDNLNERYGFKITKHPGGFGPSDQSSFYAKKIPVLHFFTGTHSDYHRPSDDTDKINLAGMRRVAELVADTAVALAESEKLPEYKATGRQATLGGGGDRPYFGSIPDFSQERPGYALSGVTKDGPAEKAGLQAGDIIVQLGDSKVGNLEDFDSALRKFKAGDRVKVVVERGDTKVEVEVTLDPPK
jgi:acetylornithine deacetylase/succinyl-diaminopimelate desuccinylase-like protein